MPKKVVRDVFGELLETGKKTAKAGTKVLTGGKTGAKKSSGGTTPSPAAARSARLDRLKMLERGLGSQKLQMQKQKEEEKAREEQIKKMAEMDKRQSMQAYQKIQDHIKMIQKKKQSQPRKYETGKADFDEEQVKDPESFWDKQKKKQKEAKKKILPWTKKKGMGTGEIRRGVSG